VNVKTLLLLKTFERKDNFQRQKNEKRMRLFVEEVGVMSLCEEVLCS
jgi:hypothetical protein